MSAATHLAQHNITVEQARAFVFANLQTPALIYNGSINLNLTADMLAEIVGGVSATAVVDFFNSNGLDGNALVANDSGVTGDTVGDDISTASTVSLGTSVTGAIDFAQDTDWYGITLEAGTQYTIALQGAETSAGALTDPSLSLLDSSGASIISDDDGGVGLNSSLNYTPSTSGVYYIYTHGYADGIGSYSLSVLTAVTAVTTFTLASQATVTEGNSIIYTVTASQAVAVDTVLDVAFSLGTDGASAEDFTAGTFETGKTLTIAAGETTATYTLTTLSDDSFVEAPESFNINVTTADGSVALTATTILQDPTATSQLDPASKSTKKLTLGAQLSDANTLGVSVLDSGNHWDNTLPITFSFNSFVPTSYDAERTINWTALNTAQETAVRAVFEKLNSIVDPTIYEVASGGSMQFNIAEIEGDFAGWGYYPGQSEIAGDIFLTTRYNTDPDRNGINVGESGWNVIAHEIGHAMGLAHPHEGTILTAGLDDIHHTIMSYNPRDHLIVNYTLDDNNGIWWNSTGLYSDSYSLFDVAALQSIYGVNTETNTENTTYSVKYTDYKIQTIWDAGGTDTIDLSTTIGNSTVDLETSYAGTLNSADQYTLEQIVTLKQNTVIRTDFTDNYIETQLQTFSDDNTLYTGKNNLGIAQGVIIENIKTGSGSDTITDNQVDNIISTYLGDDKIYLGNGGYDTVDGGGGNDTIFLNVTANQVAIEQLSQGNYILVADEFAINFVGIETIQYSDNTTATFG